MKNNESKSLSVVKQGFKKNEIVIYAIALMLVTAGYFSYSSNLEHEALETYSEELSKVDGNQIEQLDLTNEIKPQEEKENDDIGDAKLVNSDATLEKEPQVETINEETVSEETIESTTADVAENTDNSSDYFVASKLERDRNYADMISTYTKIIEDNSVSDSQKTIAMNEITKINNAKNAIAVCENLLSTKEFENFVIFENNGSINIVVKAQGGLTKEKVAQIQNIISREFGADINNIHISEK